MVWDKRFVLLDLETTGLDPLTNCILEVGCLVVEPDLSVSGSFESLVKPKHLTTCDFVTKMHTENGLFSDLSADTLNLQPISVVDTLLTDYLKQKGFKEGSVLLGGYSIHFDKSFINVHMPQLSKMLSYQLMDFSAMLKLCEMAGIEIKKDEVSHRAMDDCLGELSKLIEMVAAIRKQ